MDVKLKVNPNAMPNSGMSYIEEPSIVESAGGKRLALAITSRMLKHPTRGVITRLEIHLENYRILTFDLDTGTSLKFDDEKGIGEFTSQGIRYRIRALQDFDNYKTRDEDTDGN